eukprot:3258828-Alexandrium_andersonii.AAC.1
MHSAASDTARKCLKYVRALSGTFGHFRAVSGEARDCPKAPESDRKCSKVPESAPGTFGQYLKQ